MAIAKVQYKENASATPEVWMDTTQKTVTAGTMLSGTTALKNDGTGITGNIASKSSSDLTASGDTVTAPAGYYPNAASKSVATTTHPNPTASINATTGVVTAFHTQTSGYVAAGTTTGTLPLTTQAAKTVAPTESEQTAVSAGVYTTGAVKVGAISSTYVGSDVAQNDSSDLTASGATVTAPAGFYAESASKTVASGSASTPATSITANPTISVNASGLITASVSGSKSVTPTVSAGYVSSGTAGTVSVSGSNTQQLSTQAATTITPSTTSQTAVAAGKYTTGAVTVAAMPIGTAGTPTATKGTVSNHSISVTPSVTNTTGYITGSAISGTAVTIDVTELESGTKSITANGTGISVSGYSSVDVSVPTGGGSGLVYETGTWTPSEDVASHWFSFTNTHTEPPFYYMVADSNGDYTDLASTNTFVAYNYFTQVTGNAIYPSTDSENYGYVFFRYKTSGSLASLGHPISDTSDANSGYPRYWATETGVRAYTSSSSRYWRSGRTYKWIAVWPPTT